MPTERSRTTRTSRPKPDPACVEAVELARAAVRAELGDWGPGGRPVEDQAAQDQPGEEQAAQGQPGEEQAARDQSGEDQAAQDQPGKDQAAQDQPGKDQSGDDRAAQAPSVADTAATDVAVADAAPADDPEYLGHVVEADRVVSHRFACTDPAYRGWYWSVTVVRAARAREVTVNEVVLLPGDDALLAQTWVPWADRVGPGDIAPGVLMPTPDDDVRLEPGFTGGEDAADTDPAEASITRAVVAELGLGRERVLSREGRDRAAERWLDSDGGPDTAMASQAPAPCATCGYFVRLGGSLGTLFGACANEFSPSDGRVVSIDHGCGGHSDVVDDRRPVAPPGPVWDTVSWDSEGTLFT